MPNKRINGKVLGVSVAAVALIVAYAVSSAVINTAMTKPIEAEGASIEPTDDEIIASRFSVEIDGEVISQFREVSGISAEIEVVESKHGGDKAPIVKLPGKATYSNLVLKRGLTVDTDLSEWLQAAINGNPEKKSVSVIMFNSVAEPVARYNFENGWPCKYSLSPLNAASSEIVMESVEICHEGMSRVAP